MIRCLLSKHPQCIPADETLTSLITRTLFLGRTRRVCFLACVHMCICMRVGTSTFVFPHFCSLSDTVTLFLFPHPHPHLPSSNRSLLAVFKMGRLTVVVLLAGKSSQQQTRYTCIHTWIMKLPLDVTMEFVTYM